MSRVVTIICGPTSTGKSDLAFDLASKSPPSLIISADSRQFYKGISIISGQDKHLNLPKQCLLVGQNFLEPDQDFSISQFKKFFETQLKIFSNHNVYVVGGSGLYLKAITQNLDTLNLPPNKELRKKLETLTLKDLQQRLKDLNQKKFNNLNNSDINNPRRLIRAIEVALSPTQKTKTIPAPNLNFKWLGLKTSLENLEEKIYQRVSNRLKEGAISEVELLIKSYPDQSLPIYSTLGVGDIIDYINKKVDYKTLVARWSKSELQYAKRQITWFKKQSQIVWYDKGI